MKNQQDMAAILVKVLAYVMGATVWAMAVFFGIAFIEWSMDPGTWEVPSRVFCALVGLGIPMFAIPQIWAIQESRP